MPRHRLLSLIGLLFGSASWIAVVTNRSRGCRARQPLAVTVAASRRRDRRVLNNMYALDSQIGRRIMVTLAVFFIVFVQVTRAPPERPTQLELMRSYAATPRQVLRKDACRTRCRTCSRRSDRGTDRGDHRPRLGVLRRHAGRTRQIADLGTVNSSQLAIAWAYVLGGSIVGSCSSGWSSPGVSSALETPITPGEHQVHPTEEEDMKVKKVHSAEGPSAAQRGKGWLVARGQRRRPARTRRRPRAATTATTTAGRPLPRRDDGRRRRSDRRVRLPVDTATCTARGSHREAAAAVVDPGPVRRLLRGGRPGLLRDEASTSRSSRAASTSAAAPGLATGGADFAISWVPKALAEHEAGEGDNIAQIFQRSGTLQVTFKDAGITSLEDLAGKNDRQLGLRQRVRDVRRAGAGRTRPGQRRRPDPAGFDMNRLLYGDIDAAEAMTYNEYAQVLETVNPETGELYQPEDLNVISYKEVGVGMLQDAIWADAETSRRPAYQDRRSGSSRPRSRAGCMPGQRRGVPRHRRRRGLDAGREPPAVADERDQQADLAGRERHRRHRRGGLEPDDRDRHRDQEPRGRHRTQQAGRPRGLHQRHRQRGDRAARR